MASSRLLTRRALPVVGLGVGVWSLLPPYSGPALNTETRVEVMDHVVPGVVLLAVSVAALVTRPGARSQLLLLLAGLVVVLAGIWMTATHVPLIGQAARQEAPWDAAIYHSLPGLAVLALGTVWTATYWEEAGPPEA